jgi:hypothetical protein
MVMLVQSRWQAAARAKAANALVINYGILRKAIGIIALAWPVALFFGAWSSARAPGFVIYCSAGRRSAGTVCWQWPESLSGYYFTSVRNVFVGALCIIAVFLIVYQGYNLLDNVITNLAGIFALGVAFCPTANVNFHPYWVSVLHHVFSTLMMIFLALMALQFTRTATSEGQTLRAQLEHLWKELWHRPGPENAREAEQPTVPAGQEEHLKRQRKQQRNRVYRACSRLILLWIILAGVQNLIHALALHLFFFCEVAALWTFAVSWFVKGQVIFLKDTPKPAAPASPESPSAVIRVRW